MPTSEPYVCDADCLINLHRHFGRKAISALHHWRRTGRLKLPEGVARELVRETDDLARFVQKEGRSLEVFATDDPKLRPEIARLVENVRSGRR